MAPTDLKIVFRLVFGQARIRPGRIALTVLATIASACVVVWVVSSYDSLVQQFDEFSGEYLGRYHLVVAPRAVEPSNKALAYGASPKTPTLGAELIEALRDDPEIAALDPVFQSRTRIEPATELPPESPRLKSEDLPTLVGTDAAAPPYEMVEGAWIAPATDRLEGVLSRGAAQRLGIRLGDEVVVTHPKSNDKTRITICGIVEQVKTLPPMGLSAGMPSMRVTVLRQGPADAALYVPVALAAKLAAGQATPSFVGVVLKDGVRVSDFRSHFAERHGSDTGTEVLALAEISAELNESGTTKGVRAQAWSATGISLLAALFIIFTTLSMGVSERTREFAMLRAVALTKGQIGAMIALESIVLGLIGWGGGLLAGWAVLRMMAHWRPDFFPGGASLGWWCVTLAGACAVGGALLASIVPAWNATRVSPLEAMVPKMHGVAARARWSIVLMGLALVAVNPALVFYVPMPDTARYAVSAAVGCACTAIGFVLLAPMTIRLSESLFGPAIARALGLNARLLSTQLSSNLWRTVGTTVALTLGLGLFVAMQTWGYSMLGPFLPGAWMPEALVNVGPAGVSEKDIAEICRVPGVIADECLPLAVEQPKFVEDITGADQRASVTRQDNCIMLGIDTDRAIGRSDPVLRIRFVKGTRQEAAQKLKQGRYCLVPDHFQRETGLGVGDSFQMVPPKRPNEKVTYEIAGVVALDGWHLISKFGLRVRSGRTAAMMIAPFEQVRRDFGVERVSFFWMNLDGSAKSDDVRTAVQAIASRPIDGAGAHASDSRRGKGGARVSLQTASELRASTGQRADSIIWGMSKLPIVTLAVSVLGVLNTILSSARARRWEFGVLRAVGVTRWGIIRLIMAEALLIGAVACVLSLGFGVIAGYCGAEVTRYADIHGGPITPLIIPWTKLLPAFGVTLLLCLFAATGPAISAGRSEPLRLIQAGRSSI